MQSINLLSELEQIRLRAEHGRYTYKDVIEQSGSMRNDLFAIEVAAGVEESFSALLAARNIPAAQDVPEIPPDLFEADRLASPDAAADYSLHARYAEAVDTGPESVTSFISNLKGKLGELRVQDHLQQEFPGDSFEIAADQNQRGWDIISTSPDGTTEHIQVKVGGEEYATGKVLTSMQENPDVRFAPSNEIRDAILAKDPELSERFIDGNLNLSNEALTAEVSGNLEGLRTLRAAVLADHPELSAQFIDQLSSDAFISLADGEGLGLLLDNSGVDVPDTVGGILPYATEIILGISLIRDIVNTERDFEAVVFDDRKRVHAMKALVLFQRFGISTVLTTVGGVVGGAAGTAIPIIGNVIGAIGGAIGGAGLAALLSSKLRPHMLEIGMELTGLTEDDLFYFKNKVPIDRIGESLARTAAAM